MRPIRQIIVHQTGTPTGTVESIRRYHMTPESKGGPKGGPWKDIGYHYVITRDARSPKGRPNSEVGSHCGGDNQYSLGVCLVGEGDAFPLGRGYMTWEMLTSLVLLIQKLRAAYPTIGGNIWGHREKPSGITQGKPCPGFDVRILRAMLVG